MDYGVFIGIIAFLAIGSIWIGQKTAAEAKNNKDYYLSGRKLTVFGLTLTFLATQLGGGAIIGNAQAAYLYGWKSIYYSLGLSLGLIVLSLGVGARFRRLNVQTIPELFTKIYRSQKLRNIATFLSIVSLFFILIAIGVASRKFFTAIGVESAYAFLGFWSVAIIYTVYGGLSAVVKTDIFQVIFIAAALILAFAFVLNIEGMVPIQTILEMPATKAIPWSDWLLMPLLFVIIGQDMGQRCAAAKSPRVVSLSTFSAGILLLLLSVIPTYLGVQASLQYPDINLGGSILMLFIEQATNPIVTSFFAAGILMAIMSTADSLVCSISLNIACDFLPAVRKDRRVTSLKASRWITFFVGISALSLSLFVDEIIGMMVFAYKISILALFVPIIMAIIWKNPKKQAAYTAVIVGVIGFGISEALETSLPLDLFSIAASLICFLMVQALTKNSRGAASK